MTNNDQIETSIRRGILTTRIVSAVIGVLGLALLVFSLTNLAALWGYTIVAGFLLLISVPILLWTLIAGLVVRAWND